MKRFWMLGDKISFVMLHGMPGSLIVFAPQPLNLIEELNGSWEMVCGGSFFYVITGDPSKTTQPSPERRRTWGKFEVIFGGQVYVAAPEIETTIIGFTVHYRKEASVSDMVETKIKETLK